MVTGVVAAPIVGAKVVIVGAPPPAAVTVKLTAEVAAFGGTSAVLVTVIGPVVALAGTVTTSLLPVAELTVAVAPVPVKVTVF
jgi:hypothetical protein